MTLRYGYGLSLWRDEDLYVNVVVGLKRMAMKLHVHLQFKLCGLILPVRGLQSSSWLGARRAQ